MAVIEARRIRAVFRGLSFRIPALEARYTVVGSAHPTSCAKLDADPSFERGQATENSFPLAHK
jgi:hypothetical protein